MYRSFLFTFMIVGMLAVQAGAKGQDHHWQLGLNFPVAAVRDFRVTEPGVGLQASYRLRNWAGTHLSLDSQADYFPGIHSYSAEQKRFSYWRAAEEVSKSQVLVGLRAGRQWQKLEFSPVSGRLRGPCLKGVLPKSSGRHPIGIGIQFALRWAGRVDNRSGELQRVARR